MIPIGLQCRFKSRSENVVESLVRETVEVRSHTTPDILGLPHTEEEFGVGAYLRPLCLFVGAHPPQDRLEALANPRDCGC